jgi:hypothetical protein
MSNIEAGDNAGNETTTVGTQQPILKAPISPAARKFAEYLARRMAPMIDSAAKQEHSKAAE